MKIATILGLVAALAGFSLTSCGSAIGSGSGIGSGSAPSLAPLAPAPISIPTK